VTTSQNPSPPKTSGRRAGAGASSSTDGFDERGQAFAVVGAAADVVDQVVPEQRSGAVESLVLLRQQLGVAAPGHSTHQRASKAIASQRPLWTGHPRGWSGGEEPSAGQARADAGLGVPALEVRKAEASSPLAARERVRRHLHHRGCSRHSNPPSAFSVAEAVSERESGPSSARPVRSGIRSRHT
jgi:hypothetical protein